MELEECWAFPGPGLWGPFTWKGPSIHVLKGEPIFVEGRSEDSFLDSDQGCMLVGQGTGIPESSGGMAECNGISGKLGAGTEYKIVWRWVQKSLEGLSFGKLQKETEMRGMVVFN